ncbi:MAG: hypothetical protein ACRC1Z_06045 [Waterburya sp.]
MNQAQKPGVIVPSSQIAPVYRSAIAQYRICNQIQSFTVESDELLLIRLQTTTGMGEV